MEARAPIGRLPLPTLTVGAAFPVSEGEGLSEVEDGPSAELSSRRAVRLSSSVKLALTEVPFVQELGGWSAAPETKLTAAHWNSMPSGAAQAMPMKPFLPAHSLGAVTDGSQRSPRPLCWTIGNSWVQFPSAFSSRVPRIKKLA